MTHLHSPPSKGNLDESSVFRPAAGEDGRTQTAEAGGVCLGETSPLGSPRE